MIDRIVLVGLSGTGKSRVAPILANRLGYQVVDTDIEAESRFGLPIPDVFQTLGELTFRHMESDVLAEACQKTNVVIATGGGIVGREINWAAMRPESLIVHLTADSATIIQRLKHAVAENPLVARPLLDGHPESKLAQLWEKRAPLYARADVEIDTSDRDAEDVAAEIISKLQSFRESGRIPVTIVPADTGRSDIFVGAGLINQVGDLLTHRWAEAKKVWIISDSNVARFWSKRIETQMAALGIATSLKTVDPGETSKNFQCVGELVDWMIDGGASRRDIVIALGGGVVGDLAGFAAAITLRGLPLIQIPTSLLAMVDSSVGGKTGVNHRHGKNLIGSFYQPQLVIADPMVLDTLPPRELKAGWAEIIKHGMIEQTVTGGSSPHLLNWLAQHQRNELEITPHSMADLIAHNIQIKAAVVRADEREAGLRQFLNYGHTLGHAMEASAYSYIHGEAVGLGLRAAASIARTLDMVSDDIVQEQNMLLDWVGLPAQFDGTWEDITAHLFHDKKIVDGQLTWILPYNRGAVTLRRDVPLDVVRAVATGIGAQ